MEAGDKKKQMERELAGRVIRLARDELLIHLRFFDVALARLGLEAGLPGGAGDAAFLMTEGAICHYDPVGVLKAYQTEPHLIARSLLHVLLHCIFHHPFQYEKLDREDWDLAADVAVENVIQDMQLNAASLEEDPDRARKLRI